MKYLLIIITLLTSACGQAPKDGDINPYVVKNLPSAVHPVINSGYCNAQKGEASQTYGKPNNVVIYNDYATAFIYPSGLMVIFTSLSDETCDVQYVQN